MLNNTNTSVEHIIAAIDNNFNPDNSDYIPRVVAWTIEALGLVDATEMQYRRRKVRVVDRLAKLGCDIRNDVKVFTLDGCEVDKASWIDEDNNCSSTGEIHNRPRTPVTTLLSENSNPKYAPTQVAFNVNNRDINDRYNVQDIPSGCGKCRKSYTLANTNTIDINFDADFIYVVQKEVVTSYSELYDCEVPVIPNDSELIRFITHYCINMMLNRGEKHPVFNLSASQYGTNPYYIWSSMQDKVKRSLLNKSINTALLDSDIWSHSFYIYTFGK